VFRSLGTRLQLATAMAALAVALVLVIIYTIQAGRIQAARLALLRSVDEAALSIADSYFREAREGSLTQAAAQQAALRAIGAIRYLGTNYVWVNDLQARMVMHPIKPELNGTDSSRITDPRGAHPFAAAAQMAREHGSGVVSYMWPRPGAAEPIPKLSYVTSFKPLCWVIATGVYVDDLAQERRAMATTLSVLGLAGCALVAAVIWLIGRGITRPLRALTSLTSRLAKGELQVAVPGTLRPDELGALATALEVLRDNGLAKMRLEREAAQERAVRDRREAAMDRHTQDFGTVVSGVLARLSHAAANMSRIAGEMAQATERTRASSTQTAEGSVTSSRELGTVAAATVQLSASVEEIVRQVGHANAATRASVGRAAETEQISAELARMADRIGTVGAVISRIATQTNLLALNANIEAARAGEAGAGFSVVANEVKALARQTAQATQEIDSNVKAIRDATGQTTAAIREVSAAIAQVEAVSSAIGTAVGEQEQTTREIAQRVQEVARTSEQSAAAMTEVAGIADNTGALSQTVMGASSDIATVADTLRQEVDHFLTLMGRDNVYRRRYERVPGQERLVALSVNGGHPVSAALVDISCGGAAVRLPHLGDVGQEVVVDLPGIPHRLNARVARQDGAIIALAFQQDERTVQLVGDFIDSIKEPELDRMAA
jgi:methyl-accepting chemotaxis protein